MRCSWGLALHAARNSISPDCHETDRIHIGIDWLESVAFGHIGTIGERVLIIGVGNTADGLLPVISAARRQGY